MTMEAEVRGKEGQGRERERVRFEDARLLALKMEKGPWAKEYRRLLEG